MAIAVAMKFMFTMVLLLDVELAWHRNVEIDFLIKIEEGND